MPEEVRFLRLLGTKVGPDDILGIGTLATRLYASDDKRPQPFRHCRFAIVDVIFLVVYFIILVVYVIILVVYVILLVMYVRDSGESRFST